MALPWWKYTPGVGLGGVEYARKLEWAGGVEWAALGSVSSPVRRLRDAVVHPDLEPFYLRAVQGLLGFLGVLGSEISKTFVTHRQTSTASK